MNMIDVRNRLEFHRKASAELCKAYLALVEGGVQSYSIGSRSLTKFDLQDILDQIAEHDKKAAELEALLNGGKRRKAVGVVPRDW